MPVSIQDQGTVGDLHVSFEHGNKPGEKDRNQPMMRLRNPVQKRSYMIAMDDAWKWDDRGTDKDPQGLQAKRRIMLQAIEVCTYLYDIPSRAGACRIVDAIMQWLPDLLKMPPRIARTEQDWLRDAHASGLVVRARQGGDTVTLMNFRT